MCSKNQSSFPQQQDLKKLWILCRRRQHTVIIHHTAVSLHLSEQTGTLSLCMDMSVLMTFFHLVQLKKAVCVKVCCCLCICYIRCNNTAFFLQSFFCSIHPVFFSFHTNWCCNQHVVIPPATLPFSRKHKHIHSHTYTHTCTQPHRLIYRKHRGREDIVTSIWKNVGPTSETRLPPELKRIISLNLC